MKTIQTEIVVGPDHRATLELPDDLGAGNYRVTVVVDDRTPLPDLKEGSGPSPGPIEVPAEYAGRWIAWDAGRTRIVASGTTVDGAREAAIAAGEPKPVLGKAPGEGYINILGRLGRLG